VSNGEPRSVSPIEIVDGRVAAILRRKSGMERLKLAHEEWAVEREVAKRLLGGHRPLGDPPGTRGALGSTGRRAEEG